jgi:hypothetical protein
MRRLRFSIASLLALVVVVAVAVAALRAANEAWESGAFGATLLILLTAVLLAVHRAERRRAYWLGFALFGWTYLIASLVPSVEPRMPTTKGLAYLDSQIRVRKTFTVRLALANATASGPNTVQAVALSPQGGTLATSSQGVVRLWNVTTGALLTGPNGTTESFLSIGHSLAALVLAFLGGHASRYLYGTGRAERATLPGEPTPATQDGP